MKTQNTYQMRLLVKGNIRTAKAVAEMHGCTKILAIEERGNDTRLTVECQTFQGSFLASIQKWYNEPKELIPGYGFPPGALLWYCEKPAILNRSARERAFAS